MGEIRWPLNQGRRDVGNMKTEKCPRCESPDRAKVIDPFNGDLLDNGGPYMTCYDPWHGGATGGEREAETSAEHRGKD